MQDWLSLKSVAALVDVSGATVRKWVKEGKLPKPHAVFGERRWSTEEVREAIRKALDRAPLRSTKATDPDEATRRFRANVQSKAKDRPTHAR